VHLHGAPGDKANATWFEVRDAPSKPVRWQIVHGSKIRQITAPVHGDEDRDAPDVSLQVPLASGTDPSAEDVISIWDAKWRSPAGWEVFSPPKGSVPTSDTAISKGEKDAFLRFLAGLDVPQPAVAERLWDTDRLPARFRAPALFTNGKPPVTSVESMRDEGYSVVARFDEKGADPPVPDIGAHLAEYGTIADQVDPADKGTCLRISATTLKRRAAKVPKPKAATHAATATPPPLT
jgi:hypothetical protein